MWFARMTGVAVRCAACDAANVALAVGERFYRWSCVACLWQSHWFRIVEGELRVVEPIAVQTLKTAAL
jgi:hypothetical protein